MKFIIYKDQKKFTVDNVIVPDESSLQDLIGGASDEMTVDDLELYNLRITATRSLVFADEDIESEEVKQEVDEGIYWYQETVN